MIKRKETCLSYNGTLCMLKETTEVREIETNVEIRSLEQRTTVVMMNGHCSYINELCMNGLTCMRIDVWTNSIREQWS